MDHPVLIEIATDIGTFNLVGSFQIPEIEDAGGAQCQVDALCGRDPNKTMEASVKPLPMNVTRRPLIRSQNGVGLQVLEESDLEIVLRTIAEAGGAWDGRCVRFKLFEAQNRPEDMEVALRILSRMRKEGANVECEIAITYTAEYSAEYFGVVPGSDLARSLNLLDKDVLYDAQYYEDRTYELFRRAIAIDPDLITGGSGKDMIGLLLGGKGRVSDGNSAETYRAMLRGAERSGAKLKTFCMHIHNTGHAHEATAAVIAAHLDDRESRGPEAYVSQLKLLVDVTVSGLSFADPLDVDQTLREKYGYDLGIVEEQRGLLRKWAGTIADLRDKMKDYLIPDRLSDMQKRFAFIAGGAFGSDNRLAIQPLVSALMAKEILDSSGSKINLKPEIAENMIKALFIYVRRKLYYDNGHAHSVTPSAYNLSLSSKEVIEAMIRTGFVQEMLQSGVDLATIGESRDLAVKMQPQWIDRFPEYYSSVRHKPSLNYFRRMPRAIHPVLRKHYCDYHINEILPPTGSNGSRKPAEEVLVQSPLHGLINAGDYERVKEGLLARSVDKNAARVFLGQYIEDQEAINLFVREHIGMNEMPAGYNVKSFAQIVKDALAEYGDHGKKLWISAKGALFAAINMGLDASRKVPEGVIKLWEHPVEDGPSGEEGPSYWGKFFVDPWGKTAQEAARFREMANLNVHVEAKLPAARQQRLIQDSQKVAERITRENDARIAAYDHVLEFLMAGTREGCPQSLSWSPPSESRLAIN